jgi:hypothetical protein
VKVTRIAYSRDLNAGKYGELVEQAGRLGRVRSLLWDRYGSIMGVGLSDRQIRDAWMADGTAASFGVLANAWKETVRERRFRRLLCDGGRCRRLSGSV